MKFRFDAYHLDTEQKQVIGPDGPINLRPQTFGVLCHLVEQAPSVVSRDELLDAVWGHQATSVSSVAQTIKELRQAFEDSSSDPRLIATRRGVGYQFVAAVERTPETATASADATGSGAEAVSVPAPERGNRPWLIAAAALAALIILSVWWAQPPPANAPPDPVPTLTVNAMTNSGDDRSLDWLAPALTTYLGHALVELGGFHVVPVGARADADYWIEARYGSAAPNGVSLGADLRRPGDSDVLLSLETRHPDWDIAELSIDLAGAIRDTLGFTAPPDADSAAIRLRLPRSADAQKAHFAAVEALDELESAAALEQIEAARRSEPDHPRLDHLEALALSQRGDLRAAREAAARAMERSALWPRRDRLDLEATAAALDFDFARAADRLQSVNQRFPESSSIRRMIDAQIKAGRLDAAEQALVNQSDRLGDPAQRHLLESQLAAARDDHPAQLESGQLAAQLARQAGQLQLADHGRLAEAQAFLDLGDHTAAAQSLQPLLGRPRSSNEIERARALLLLARVHLAQGELDSALSAAERARNRFEAIPAPIGTAEASLLLAALHDQAGRSEQSISILTDAIGTLDAIGDRQRRARANLELASVFMRVERSELALDRLEQARASFRSLGDRRGEAEALFNQASVLRGLERAADAEPVFQRALEAYSDAEDLLGRARSLDALAGIAGERGNLPGSIRLREEALEIFDLLEARAKLGRAAFELSQVHRRLGDLAASEQRMRQSVDAFAATESVTEQARALSALGRIMITMNRFDALDPILSALEELAASDAAARMLLYQLRGHRDLLTGRDEQARAEFRAASNLVAEAGLSSAARELELDLARVALATGQTTQAEQRARELEASFDQAQQLRYQIDALLLLAQALIAQQRSDEADAVLSLADQQLAESPDAEQTLEIALLRSLISGGAQAQQRLDWIEQTAARQGFERFRQRASELRQRP
ncbi:MAG: tetratricopeptide repeat protein [Wenzhouxiangella sp.]|nr:tetratricopeptide repeat protein [Wenzhouxiangella sp.]